MWNAQDIIEYEKQITALQAQVDYWEDESNRLRRALEDCVMCFNDDDTLVTPERMDAWLDALKPRIHPMAEAEVKEGE